MIMRKYTARLFTRPMLKVTLIVISAVFYFFPAISIAATLFSDDFESGFNWTASNGTLAGVNNDTSNSPTNSMYTRGGVVTVDSPTIDTSSVTSTFQIDVWIRKGSNTFSNAPENGENLEFGYLDNGGTFVVLETFTGGGTAGQIYTRTYTISASTAFYANFQIRARQTGGSGTNFDYWHIDDVVVYTPLLGSCDYFDTSTTLSSIWTVSGAGGAAVNNLTSSTAPNSLELYGGEVFVTSSAMDTSAVSTLQFDVWIRRGDDSFSENPDNGEDLEVQYYNSSGNWITLETFAGQNNPPIAGEIFVRSYVLPADAIHANFQIRFHKTGGNGGTFDDWHVDDVCLPTSVSPTVYAEYRFDELLWNGTAGEVIDNTGNGNDGTAIGSAVSSDSPSSPPGSAITGNPGTCGIGVFPKNTSTGTIDAVDTGIDVNTIGDTGSITFWYYSNSAWTGGGDRMLFDASTTTGGGKYFFLELLNNGDLRFAFEDQTDADYSVETTPQAFAANTWVHIAVTWDIPNNQMQIFVNAGTPTVANPVIGASLNNQLQSLYVGDNRSTHLEAGSTGNSANGGIDEFRIYKGELSQAEIQTIRDETHTCALLSEWRFEEISWNGTTNEVVDETTSGNNGTAASLATPPTTANVTPAIGTDPGTCRYGVFNRANKDYIALPSTYPNLGATGDFTIAAWIRTTDNTQAGQRIMIDDENNTGGWGFSLGDGGTGNLRFFARNMPATFILDSGNVIANNTWYYVAVTVNTTTNTITLYRYTTGGTLSSVSNTYTGAFNTDAGPPSIGGETNAAGENTSSFGFSGNIDWVRVYQTALSQNDINTLRQRTHPCSSGPNHYAISHSGTAVTCLPTDVTITGHDIFDAAVDPGNVTITLTTSTGKGDWTTITAGTGTLNNGTAGDGSATYTFPGGETAVTLALNYTDTGGANSETFNIDVTDGAATDPRDNTDPEDQDLTFSLTGFRFYNVSDGNSTIPLQISGKSSNTGFNSKTLALQAIRSSDSDPSVCTAAFPIGSDQVIDLGAECRNPTTCAGKTVSITNNGNTTTMNTNNNNGGNGTSSYTPTTLRFTDSGSGYSQAVFSINYPDAGQIQLHSQYDIPLDDGSASGDLMTGSSNTFVVRPFALSIESGDANFTAADANGTAFKKAGENFDVTIQAVVWQSGEDTDNNGVPDSGADLTDNAVTPNFGNETVAPTVNITRTLALPTGGNAGTLTGGSGIGSFGAVNPGETTATLSFDEVGIIDLTATHTSYLGSGSNITSTRSDVGRFYPDRFTVTDNMPGFADACTAGTNPFTYMGQTFFYNTAPVLTVTAVNVAGAVTSNYGDTSPASGGGVERFWKLSSTLPRSYSDTTGHGPANFASTSTASVTLGGDLDFDGQGTLTLANDISGGDRDSFLYTRTTEEAPFGGSVDLTFQAAGLTDTDGVCYDPDNNGTCDDYTHLTQAGVEAGSAAVSGSNQRFGRLVIGSAAGSELLPVVVPFRTEYYTGTGFQTNSDDQCMALNTADISLTSAVEGPIAGGPVDVSNAAGCADGHTSITMGAFSGGEAGLTFTAPGDQCTGYANVDLDLGAISLTIGTINYPDLNFLKYDWNGVDEGGDGNVNDDNPSGRADFGVFDGPRELIYFREPW